MTPRKATRWSLLALFVVFALVASACQPTPPAGASPAPGGTAGGEEKDPNAVIKIWMSSEPLNYDPQVGSFVNEIAVNSLVFEPLYLLDAKTSAPVPAVAAALPQVSPDGMTYTIKLNSGIKYSDGQALTAKNFAYAIARGCDPRQQSEYAFVLYDIVGCQEYNETDAKDTAALNAAKAKVGVTAKDDTTLEIKLKAAAGYFTAILTMWPTYPSREDMVTKGGETWWQSPATFVGNGPMVLKEWQRNQKFVFEANPNYRQKLQFKGLEYVIINEASVALAAYKDDQLDMTYVASADLRAVEADAALSAQMVDRAGSCTYYFGFNVRKPPFDDPNIRLAFSKAYDRDDFIKNVRNGLGVAATSFIMPGVPGNDATDDVQKYDVAAAKAAFSKASEASKAGLTGLKYTYSENATNKTIAEWATNQWKTNLGVTVELEPIAPTAYSALFRKGLDSPQLFFLGWCWDFPDPQNQLTTVWAHGNFASGRTGYNTLNESKEFDALVDKADRLANLEERVTIYKEAGKLLSKHAPASWVQYNKNKELVKPWIKGITFNPGDHGISGFFSLQDIYVLRR